MSGGLSAVSVVALCCSSLLALCCATLFVLCRPICVALCPSALCCAGANNPAIYIVYIAGLLRRILLITSRKYWKYCCDLLSRSASQKTI